MRAPGLAVAAALTAFASGAAFVIEGGRTGAATDALPGSVLDPGPEGLSLAYAYLRERARADGGSAPSALTERPRPASLPEGGVLFRMRPSRLPPRRPSGEDEDEEPPLLGPEEEAWVRAGGRIVLGLDSGYGPVAVDEVVPPGQPRKALQEWPGVTLFQPVEGFALSGPPVDAGLALVVSGRSVLASRLDLGRGDVVLLGLPDLLQNDTLAKGDHLPLLERLAGRGRPVVFDEWAHGLEQADGLLPRLVAWGYGPALVVGGLAFGLALWRGRARLGPPDPDPPEPRSEAVDLVESLGQLYERALSRRDAARLHLQSFQRAVSLRTGTSGEALERRVRDLLGGAPDPLPPGEIPAADFARRLARINDGYRRLQEHARARRRP